MVFGQQDVKLSRSRLGESLGRMSPKWRIIDDGPWKEGSSLAAPFRVQRFSRPCRPFVGSDIPESIVYSRF